jgi:acetyl esterase/lipase
LWCGAEPVRYCDEVFPGVSVTSHIPYRETVSTQPLALDLYEPTGDGESARRLFLWVVGGGFFLGDKTDGAMVGLCTAFALRGYVCASLNYRLLLKSKDDWTNSALLRAAVLQGVEDVRAAVAFLSAGRQRYRLDMSRVVLGGGSAGAVSSLHTAYGAEKKPIPGVRFIAVIDFWGALFDLKLMTASGPPVLIIHGTEDRTVPYRFAKDLAERARLMNVDHELHTLQGVGHSAWKDIARYTGWISDFLCKRGE